jgi:azurin
LKKQQHMTYRSLAFFAFSFLLFSCGNEAPPASESSTEAVVEAAEEASASSSESELENGSEQVALGDTLFVEIEANDQMKYSTERIDAYIGQVVALTLKNVGEMPKEAMGHNWTLLRKGADFQNYATKAMLAKEDDFLPADLMGEVVAHTGLLGPGESETIFFDVPEEAGPYKFLCSFPGHFGTMQGLFFVRQ